MMGNYTEKIGIGIHAPPGTYPGFGAENSKNILVLMVVTMILIIPIVVLRLYTRLRIVRFFGWDDWLILISCLGTTAFAIYSTYTVMSPQYANGVHIEYVNTHQVTMFFISFWLFEMGYAVALTLVKSGILAYYIRLQPKPIFIYTLVFVILSGIAITLAFMFQCTPIYLAWDIRESGGKKCINTEGVVFTSAGLSIATDFWVWLLAIRMFKGLKVPKRQKIGVILIFSVGIVACVSSIVRMLTVKRYYTSSDPTWDMFPIVIWSFLEVGLGILAACIPTIKPLVQKFISGFDRENGAMILSRSRSWRMRGTLPDDSDQFEVSPRSRQKSSLSTARTLVSRVSAYFSKEDKTAVNTANTNATTLSEVRDWGLDANDFCTNLDRRHTLPDTEEEEERNRRSRRPECVAGAGDAGDFEIDDPDVERGMACEGRTQSEIEDEEETSTSTSGSLTPRPMHHRDDEIV